MFWSSAVPTSMRSAELEPLKITTFKVAVGNTVVGGALVIGAAVVVVVDGTVVVDCPCEATVVLVVDVDNLTVV